MSQRGVNIAMACDRGYLYPLAVALTSYVRHSPRPLTLSFGLAADWRRRLSPEEVAQVGALADHLGVNFGTVETSIEVEGLPPTLHISPTAFVKLALLDACGGVETIIWLDADTVAMSDWSSILTASRGSVIAAAPELHTEFEDAWPAETSGWYANTGVMVVRSAEWQTSFAGRWRNYVDAYEAHRFRYLDQDVLNALVRDQWHHLSHRYNFRLGFSGEWKDPLILHFAGWWKPWMRTGRQVRLLPQDWRRAFDIYAEAEGHLARTLETAPRGTRAFWDSQRRRVRGTGGWRAYRHYVRGMLNGEG